MSDIHIDDFYKDSALILSQLFAFFPRPNAVYVEDIAGADHTDDFGLHSQRHMACLGAMLWLAQAGYLHYADTIRQEAIDQAVLSHKGFTLLSSPCEDPASLSLVAKLAPAENLPPSVIQERYSNINVMRTLVAQATSGDIRQFMTYLMNCSRGH
ncbi:hypothetical protein R50072_21960 [Simiduia litorea]|uniref:hypothetical protein n=1 Tax=Simiduia litorea TaxID=1435348 RepID=UPI0036F1B1DB